MFCTLLFLFVKDEASADRLVVWQAEKGVGGHFKIFSGRLVSLAPIWFGIYRVGCKERNVEKVGENQISRWRPEHKVIGVLSNLANKFSYIF